MLDLGLGGLEKDVVNTTGLPNLVGACDGDVAIDDYGRTWKLIGGKWARKGGTLYEVVLVENKSIWLYRKK
jgi:hypothetical protein